ncbi:MAG: AAA family ATPase [Deltaproteobacteria bacterium]|nr:AAA family ATPase [Deltaproteobacteria bacterium]
MAQFEAKKTIFTGRVTLVSRARHEGRPVVIKQLAGPHPSQESIHRLRKEYETITALAGPGVVRVLGLQSIDGLPAIIEEDVGGESVAFHLRQGRTPSLKQALNIALATANALSRVHRSGVIHKDVNPANIVWNHATGAVQLIDFGIASRFTREAPSLASTARLEGTLTYIAPEQTGRMNRPVDTRADLYSLGATLFELLAGRPPFETDDALASVHAHVARTPPKVADVAPHVPLVVSQIVDRLLAKAAEDRYQTAAGLAADLTRCLEGLASDEPLTSFPLGAEDRQEILRIPGRLYGRGTERQLLLEAFAGARAGGLEVVLVAGYSGVGKTSLIRELVPPVVQARGAFIAGKFEQFSRGRPYASLLQALGSFVRQLLSGREEHVAAWRSRLLHALQGDGRILTEVLPELSLIIGEQPGVVELPPTEAANRFTLVFQRFVRALASVEHPVVLFFDDLQWADLPTLTLLEALATDDATGHLLVVGAYRDNEVQAGHPLRFTIGRIEAARSLSTIRLAPLEEGTVGEIVADSLGVPVARVEGLAGLVFAKTRGNPFFGTQFLEALYRDELVCFDLEAGEWTWSQAEIEAREITANVVDFMAGRIRRLPDTTTFALSRAAFFGTQFDVGGLATVLGQERSAAEQALEAALESELISVTDHFAGTFRFVHDRVQQAAFSLSDSADRPTIHRDVGRLLHSRLEDGGASVFDVVNSLNAGRSAIDDAEERDALRALNLEAGRRALGAAAYQPAWGFLQVGLELLPDDAWTRLYDDALDLHLEAARAAYLSQERSAMDALVDVVLREGRSELDKVRAYEVDIYARFSAGELSSTIERGLEVLAILGVHLPAEPTQEDVIGGLGATQAALAETKAEEIYALPADRDGRTLAISRILNTLTSPAYFARPSLLPMLAFGLVRNGLEHGLAPETPYGFSVYGLILCSVGDLRGGITAGETAIGLIDRVPNPRIANLTRHIYLAHIRFWYHHWRELREPEKAVFKAGYNLGDFLFAGFGAQMSGTSAFFGQDELGPVLDDMRESHAAITRLGQAIPQLLQDLQLEPVVALREGTDTPNELSGEYFDERTQVPVLVEGGDTSNLYVFSVLKTLQTFMLGDALAAADAAEANQQWLAGAASSLYAPMYLFLDTLAHLAAWDRLDAERQERVKPRLASNRATLVSWAEVGPMNLMHRVALLDAEWARVFGGDSPYELYPKAIAATLEGGWIGDRALGNELAGRYAHSLGNITVARAYLAEARHLYERWGANAKVAAMEVEWPALLERARDGRVSTATNQGTTGSLAIDSLAVVRASRVLTQDLELGAVIEALLRISLETSGARKGVLVLVEEHGLVAHAEGIAGNAIRVRGLGVPALESGVCPAGVLLYVQRTREPVVLADAAAEGPFVNEDMIASEGIKSVLCVPLEHQGRLRALLYLENAETASVFTLQRVELMQTLGAQAAISIENAALYGSLEEKVIERTQELADARRRSDELLGNILPAAIATELKAVGHAEPVAFESTSVLFTDFVGFTHIAEQMSASRLVAELDEAFSAFDAIIEERGLEKLKTIGDAYMCAGGVPRLSTTHAADCILAGLAFQDYIDSRQASRTDVGDTPWTLRVGIHSGPLVAGVIGTRKFAYDVWGETVNTASRMESSGVPGRVNVSQATYAATEPLFEWTDRGEVAAKGLGRVPMYFVDGIRPELSVDGEGRVPNEVFAKRLAALTE